MGEGMLLDETMEETIKKIISGDEEAFSVL
jgi:hypothetical protein